MIGWLWFCNHDFTILLLWYCNYNFIIIILKLYHDKYEVGWSCILAVKVCSSSNNNNKGGWQNLARGGDIYGMSWLSYPFGCSAVMETKLERLLYVLLGVVLVVVVVQICLIIYFQRWGKLKDLVFYSRAVCSSR